MKVFVKRNSRKVYEESKIELESSDELTILALALDLYANQEEKSSKVLKSFKDEDYMKKQKKHLELVKKMQQDILNEIPIK